MSAALVAGLLGLATSIGLSSPPTILPLPIGLVVVVGLAGFLALYMLPWAWLAVLFVGLAADQRLMLPLHGTHAAIAILILAPLALRVVFFTPLQGRPKWEWAEWAIIGWVALQFITSFLNAPNKLASFATAGILMLGVLTYLTIYTSANSRERLIFLARLFLLVSAAASAFAVASELAHVAAGTTFGIGHLPGYGPVERGLSYEPDLLGSNAGAAVIAFLILARERNPVVGRGWALVGFWISFMAMGASLARGAAVGFVVAVVALLILRRRPDPRRGVMLSKVIPLATVVALVAVGVVLVSAYAGKAQGSPVGEISTQIATKWNSLLNGSGTAANRAQKYGSAVSEALSTGPIIGLGTGSYGQRNLNYLHNPPVPGYIGNLYVRTLYDSGIVGLLLLLAFLLRVAWPSGFLMRSENDLAPVARAFIFGYALMAVAYAATDGSLQLWPWIVLGLARAARALAARGTVAQPPTAEAAPTAEAPPATMALAGRAS